MRVLYGGLKMSQASVACLEMSYCSRVVETFDEPGLDLAYRSGERSIFGVGGGEQI